MVRHPRAAAVCAAAFAAAAIGMQGAAAGGATRAGGQNAPPPPASATPPSRVGATGAPSFTRDVAPILFRACASCHNPGGAAPFSVLSYEAVRPRARQIALVTRNHTMPPWNAESEVGEGFVGQPRLSEHDLAVIEQWVAGGAVEGDPTDLPPPPSWSEGWRLGTPDLIVRPSAPYTLRGDGTDVFRIFVIPLPVDGVKFVRGLEFHPGNPKVVHHANIRIDRTPTSRQFDDADPGPGYEGLIAHTAGYPDGHFLAWTPGQVPPLLPKGLAWRLYPNTDLVVELHMQPSGQQEIVQPEVGLFFGADPPDRTPAMLRLGRQNIEIEAGERRHVVTDSFTLPVDVEVEAVQPHAHQRAREVTGTAVLPDGTRKLLIHIPDWEFRWQHVYRYQQPFTLPKGTTLQMEIVYDNSSDNRKNPDFPPRHVYWGQRSADEMGDLWVQVLTRNDRDLQALNDRFRPKVLAEDIIGYERWVSTEPGSAPLHDDLAMLYLEANRPADAVRHFAASAALKPQTASAHFNLATALTIAGNTDAAVAEYRRALALNPDYAQAHNNLGSILLHAGKPAEAMPHFQEALRVDPDNPQAHYNAATALRLAGRTVDAASHYQAALRLMPDSAQVLVDYARLLATAPEGGLRNAAEAMRLAQRAVDLTHRTDAGALEALAAAYAAAGDRGKAAEAAEAGLGLAPTDPILRSRLDAYLSPRQRE